MGLFNFFRKKENPEAEAEAMFNEVESSPYLCVNSSFS